MNKVGILTYHTSDNFGSVLQAYALQKAIQNLGKECEIIDYRKKEVVELYQILKPNSSRYNILTNLYSILYYKQLEERKRRFEQFRKENLVLSNRQYRVADELKEVNGKYEGIITGSDQVWNVNIIDFDLSYVLHFFNGKRIAYAASCGPKGMTEEMFRVIQEDIEKYSYISIRESSTAAQLSTYMGKEIPTMIDPVFLLTKEEWDNFAISEEEKEEYILCYFPGGTLSAAEEYSATLARKLGVKRIIMMPEWRNIRRKGVKQYNTGPIDFVRLIANAKCVCTSSFHGTALSIILGTPFRVIMDPRHEDKRLMNILEKCGLEHAVTLGREVTFDEMNFKTAHQQISALREEALQVLETVLSK